jgi:pilus assembly protein CpaE
MWNSGFGEEQVMNPKVDNSLPFSVRPATNHLSIAVIGPDESLRTSLLDALNECQVRQVLPFLSYPPRVQDVNNLIELRNDIVMIELDSDHDYAVEIVRAVCAGGNSTVMVYSKMLDSEVPHSDLLMRCIRLGAREFLNPPFAGKELQEALERAALRQQGPVEPKKAQGRLMVFCAAKGGAGTTNIACNFAIALARKSGQKTLLIDMDLPLGDVALNLGISSRYSTIDALQNYSRVDSTFLSRLLVHHSSGLAVLPAPGRFPAHPAPTDAIDRLLSVARQDFDNVVVDAGSKFDLASGCTQYRETSILYLVTQSGIPELRNATQLIAQCQSLGGPKLEIVLNRYEPSESDMSEGAMTRALAHPISWGIPNDYKAARRMQDTSAPVVESDSSIARHIEAMARAACGLPPEPPREKESGLRRWFSRAAKRIDKSDSSTISKMELTVDTDSSATSFQVPHPPVGSQSVDDQRRPSPDLRSSSPWNC